MQNQCIKIAMLATVAGFGGAEKVVLSMLKNINHNFFQIFPAIMDTTSMFAGPAPSGFIS